MKVISGVLAAFGWRRSPRRARAISSPPSTLHARSVEARAEQELKRMGDLLRGSLRFAFEARRRSTSSRRRAGAASSPTSGGWAVERPNHVAADATGDTLNAAFLVRRSTVTVLDKEHNRLRGDRRSSHDRRDLHMLAADYGLCCRSSTALLRSVRVLMEGVTYGALPGDPPGRGRRLPPPRVPRRTRSSGRLDRRG